ncbi:beta-ketoacyl synthase N-terminal-like domain-containing protein [Kitasatospora sp. NPDC057015]|uniref:beta-ketoacyl synthase N-terminal-like domain-containing protein n=1 Tax=Kitasatospora sp. NPDC057015 TaxID=3346001 RepID=UPI00363FF7F5
MRLEEIRALLEEQLRLSRSLRQRVGELEEARHAPLAVVSVALRLPGGLSTPEQYWDFLLSDADGRGPIPADRPALRAVHDPRPGLPGRSYVDRAGFLDDIAGFDPAFFGISQREAEAIDPQQRLLLETAWEAAERAGLAMRRQDRLPVGVFLGIMTSEYAERFAGREDKSGIDPYYGIGAGHSMAAGRVSYVMGLSGPAVSVDTACSSSLVALHLAAQSLRREECRYALVGGANLLLSADLMVSLCQSRALAPDGRSKSFTAAADGYGRGEGVGMLMLMRLADAEAEGRPVLAVLRGSATNHDGASSGLTVPNGPAQQEVIRAAYRDARTDPAEVGWVEAHGTGTSLGDPIEAGALDAVLGSGAPGRTSPLAIGSVKSRFGHLEAAAGVAGLIKVALMLRHGIIPAALGPDDGELNTFIPWDRTRLTVPRAAAPWPGAQAGRVAGISAFGMSGTNAHAVLTAHRSTVRPRADAGGTVGGPELVVLSARHPDSLHRLAVETAAAVEDADGERLRSVGHTLRVGRVPFEHRIAVTGRTGAELARALRTAVEQHPTAPVGDPPVVRLTVVEGPSLRAGLDALAAAHPGLASPAATEAGLIGALARLGLRVKPGGPALPAGVHAALEWDGTLHPLVGADPAETPELLLAALGALFTAGADLRFEALRPAGEMLVGDLPTYAFRRRRCWVDEPTPSGGAGTGATVGNPPHGAGTGAATGDDERGVEEFLRSRLAGILHADELDGSRPFAEAGGDSFGAMQLTVAVEEEYGVDDLPLDLFLEDVPLDVMFHRLSTFVVSRAAVPAHRRSLEQNA